MSSNFDPLAFYRNILSAYALRSDRFPNLLRDCMPLSKAANRRRDGTAWRSNYWQRSWLRLRQLVSNCIKGRFRQSVLIAHPIRFRKSKRKSANYERRQLSLFLSNDSWAISRLRLSIMRTTIIDKRQNGRLGNISPSSIATIEVKVNRLQTFWVTADLRKNITETCFCKNRVSTTLLISIIIQHRNPSGALLTIIIRKSAVTRHRLFNGLLGRSRASKK